MLGKSMKINETQGKAMTTNENNGTTKKTKD